MEIAHSAMYLWTLDERLTILIHVATIRIRENNKHKRCWGSGVSGGDRMDICSVGRWKAGGIGGVELWEERDRRCAKLIGGG